VLSWIAGHFVSPPTARASVDALDAVGELRGDGTNLRVELAGELEVTQRFGLSPGTDERCDKRVVVAHLWPKRSGNGWLGCAAVVAGR
jgi:hypothetical protein